MVAINTLERGDEIERGKEREHERERERKRAFSHLNPAKGHTADRITSNPALCDPACVHQRVAFTIHLEDTMVQAQ